jgi:hypothetical protein
MYCISRITLGTVRRTRRKRERKGEERRVGDRRRARPG